jgi:uncharacterized membrane protein (DUF4010 family)
MELREEFQRLAIALGLGLIVGLQRERTGQPLAGFRTFPLITLFGALTGLLSVEHGGWVLAGGLLCVATLMAVGSLSRDEKSGITTEAAILVMFAVGALTMTGETGIAAIVGGTVAVLLHLKPQMHSVARRLEDPDFKAIMQFVLITLVILPILPNQTFGPYKVLNPHKIWLMVVLIVGISIAGYIAYRFFGQRVGTLAGGILGGLISSTATTVSYARRTKETPEASATAALVIMAASAIVFVRVFIIIAAVAPEFLGAAAGPIGTVFAVMGAVALVYWKVTEKEASELPRQANPSELKAALIFAALYAMVLLAAAAAKQRFGNQGLFVVSILSGLTDMDAITLSLSEMVQRKQISSGLGWRLVLSAALSNLVFKAGAVAFLGSGKLFRRILVLFGISLTAGVVLIFLWPGPE